MYNYHKQINFYEETKVDLSEDIRDDLYAKRETNRKRLKSNLPENIKMAENHFIPQGSMAMRTTIQENGQEYDIDDGVWFYAEDLKKKGIIFTVDMTVDDVRQMVLDAVKDDKFNKSPKIMDNCIRVFYAEGYHVDIPAYRLTRDGDNEVQEIAGKDAWRKSNPTEINSWFDNRVQELNKQNADGGKQFRKMIRLMKRFSKSRGEKWDMPSGLKLTMLIDESFQFYLERDDEAFYNLLKTIKTRLDGNLAVYNRAQNGNQDMLTKTNSDTNMMELKNHIGEALVELAVIEKKDCTKKAVRKAWDWVFKTDGFLDDFDENDDNNDKGIAPVVPTAPVVKQETKFGSHA